MISATLVFVSGVLNVFHLPEVEVHLCGCAGRHLLTKKPDGPPKPPPGTTNSANGGSANGGSGNGNTGVYNEGLAGVGVNTGANGDNGNGGKGGNGGIAGMLASITPKCCLYA